VRILRPHLRTGSFALLLISACAPLRAQSTKSPLAPIPVAERAALTARLAAYTEAFRKRDWSVLYDLVADNDKDGLDGKLKVTRRSFVADMQGTYDLQRLIKFTPVRTAAAAVLAYDIYGCGEIPYGHQKLERIAALRAVMGKHGEWVFVDWDYAEPPTPCSSLSDSWKPQVPLRLDGPMSQVSCEIFTCTL
jgi:hypothetical protein